MALIYGSNSKEAKSGAAKQDAAGNYVKSSSGGSSSSSSSTPSSTSSTPTATSTPSAATTSSKISDAEVNKYLDSTSLSADEKAAIRAVYLAVANGDQDAARKMAANLELAKQYADPLLKQQIALITDDLTRTVEGLDDDLEYREKSLTNRLNDLKSDTAFNKTNLSLDYQQQLKDLEVYFDGQLQTTRDTMAAQGFTASSRRANKEKILAEQKGGMVESANRAFGVNMRSLNLGQERAERDTALELQRLREMTAQNKTSAARTAESQIGTEGVRGLTGIKPLGDETGTSITGTAQLDYQDQLSDFVF